MIMMWRKVERLMMQILEEWSWAEGVELGSWVVGCVLDFIVGGCG